MPACFLRATASKRAASASASTMSATPRHHPVDKSPGFGGCAGNAFGREHQPGGALAGRLDLRAGAGECG